MIREIVTYPDRRLKQNSKDVDAFDAHLHTLLDDMYETMLYKNGIGLAAIQIGVPLNVLIINVPDESDEQSPDNLLEVINPKIVCKEGEIVYTEGCLSVPEYYDDVVRAQKITVEFFNREGQKQTLEAEDVLAVAFQHEMDHLKGHLFIEKLSILKRKKFEKEFKKKQKAKK